MSDPAAKPPTILVIDDDAEIRYSLTRVLGSRRYQVTEAGSGEVGIAMVKKGPWPDLVFLDVRMSGMSGIEALQHIRSVNPKQLVVLMTASQFITQKQIMSKNISQAMKESPTYKQQQILLYILPLVFLFSGFAFPLGVMMYWLVSNFWTMGQQFVVIRNMPTPGSEAFHAWEARQEKKNIRKGIVIEAEPIEEVKPAQRQQPMGKNRAKRGKGKK
jgi:CheY-like chemotaxis protein